MVSDAVPPGQYLNCHSSVSSVVVGVPPDVAFRIFTEEIDLWWRRGLKYRVAGTGPGSIHLEPR
jgi:hypothetical protein